MNSLLENENNLYYLLTVYTHTHRHSLSTVYFLLFLLHNIYSLLICAFLLSFFKRNYIILQTTHTLTLTHIS